MKAVKSIRNVKFGNVETAPLPAGHNAANDAILTNIAWGLSKDIICTTARDIVNKLPLLPKLRRVQYERRWKALVDLLKSRQAKPELYAIALLTLQRDIDAQLDGAKRYSTCTRLRLVGLIAEWKKIYSNGHPPVSVATARIRADTTSSIKQVNFEVDPAKEETKN